MLAIVLSSTGGPEVLRVNDVPEPIPRVGEVLLDVRAAGVTFADTLMRAGAFPAPLTLPAVLGREVVGTVAGRGDGVQEPPLGTRVAARVPSGGYAERAVARVENTVAVPDAVGDAQALGVLGAGLTAQGAVDAGRVSRDDHVVVTAAAGAIGSLAVQLAARRGGHVIGLASTPSKRDLIRSLGAATALDSTTDWEPQVRTATAGHGIDVMLDSVGGPALTSGLRLLARRGRHVLYGFASGTLGHLDEGQLGAILQGNQTVTGFTLDLSDDDDVRTRISELLGLVVDGSLQVPTSTSYRLTEAAEAHHALSTRATSGKVVLTVGPPA